MNRVFFNNIPIEIKCFIFTFIFFIFLCYDELLSCIFYCGDGSKDDSKEDSDEDSKDDSDDDSDESSSEEDELAHLEKKCKRISKDVKDIDHEISQIDKANKLDKKLPESAKNFNSHNNFINDKYPNWDRRDLREYLVDEQERLLRDKKEYESKISQAKESKGDTKVDSLMGNKRKESSIEDRDPNRIKRKKSSNNDDSSGFSGPSAPFGPTSDSNVPDTGNSESRENDLSKIIIGKIAFILREMKRVLTDFIDKIL